LIAKKDAKSAKAPDPVVVVKKMAVENE